MRSGRIDLRTVGWPITLLCPSRGRVASLRSSVIGARELASAPELVDVVVVADPDDLETAQAAAELRCRVVLAPERFGYSRLHEYYNFAASVARGGWLMLWNDDAQMVTRGWDEVIASQGPGMLWPGHNDPGHAHCNLFPVWPSLWSLAAGRVAGDIHVDSWLQEIGAGLGLQWRVPLEVYHDRADVTGGHHDQTWTDSQAERQHSGEFFTAEMDSARRMDIEKIRGTL